MEQDDAQSEDQKETKEKEKEREAKTEETGLKDTEDGFYDEREDEPMARYEFFLKELLAALKAKLDPTDGLFTKLLLDAPELPPSAIKIVKDYCEEEKR